MNNFARTLAVELAEVTFVVALPCFMHIHKILLMFAKGHIKEEVIFPEESTVPVFPNMLHKYH